MNNLVLQAVLDRLESEMERLYWNKNQKEMLSPFRNTGEMYKNDTFKIRAYRWDDDKEEDAEFNDGNFVYGDLTVWWYKHIDRGLEYTLGREWNKGLTLEFLEQMLEDCIESLQEDWNIK